MILFRPKFALPIALMILGSQEAMAREYDRRYQIIQISENYTTYVDTSTLSRNGNFVSIWQLATFITDNIDDIEKIKSRSIYDCHNFRVLNEQMNGYRRGILVKTEMGSKEWAPVVPDTNGEQILNFACFGRIEAGFESIPLVSEEDADKLRNTHQLDENAARE